jgi:hypothetical protein
MPDVYYHCHNCGSIHEVEAIRLNLHLAGNPLGDAWFPRRSLLGWLEYRRVTLLVMRALWRAGRLEESPKAADALPVRVQPWRAGSTWPAQRDLQAVPAARKEGPGGLSAAVVRATKRPLREAPPDVFSQFKKGRADSDETILLGR